MQVLTVGLRCPLHSAIASCRSLSVISEMVEGEVMVDQAALNGETEEARKHPNDAGESYEIKDLLNTHYAYRGTVVCGQSRTTV